MTEDRRNEGRELAAQQAAEWLLLPAETLSPHQRAELADWLRESPIHVAEMLRALRVHEVLQNYRGWEKLPPGWSASADNVVALRDAAPAARRDGQRAPNRWWKWAAAAALAAVIAGSAWMARTWGQLTLQTLPGERREMTLADGSVVDLAPATELRVRFGAVERDLWLLKGEAFFHVRKDARRPFLVAVDGARVRAVGTAFGVRRGNQATVVTVLEGRVSVIGAPSGDRARPSAAQAVLVGANEQLRIPDKRAPDPVQRIDAAAETAWTAGELIFENQPVEEVVGRFNAYNRMQILVDDPRLGARRVSGVFRASDPESFVTFLQSVADLPPVRIDGQRIHIGVAGSSAGDVP